MKETIEISKKTFLGKKDMTSLSLGFEANENVHQASLVEKTKTYNNSGQKRP